MRTVQPGLIEGKRVLLRMDLDVPLKQVDSGQWTVEDDFRLRAGLPTLEMCLQHAESVIIMGHVGRPEGQDPKLSVKPIVDWLERYYADVELPEGILHVLENLRFEAGEDSSDPKFAQELASLGDFYINDAFASHHPAASTTLLPTLLPHAAGLTFAKEVEELTSLKQHPKKPFVAIIGGAKIEDKLPVLQTFAQIADAVLVGGKLPEEIKAEGITLPSNVLVAKMNEQGTDLSAEVADAFRGVILSSKQVVWAGPMGKYEDGFIEGTKALAQAVIQSGAHSVVGGGDTITVLDELGLLNKFSFVSTGGGAMLEFLVKDTLATIEALS